MQIAASFSTNLLCSKRQLKSVICTFWKLWEQENSRWILWFPVALGVGIWAYFSLACEPTPNHSLWAVVGTGVTLTGVWSHSLVVRRMMAGCFAVCLGFGVAQYHTTSNAHPMLTYPLSGVVLEGTIVDLEHLQPNEKGLAYRVVLDKLRIRKTKKAWAWRHAKELSKIRMIIGSCEAPLWVGQRLRVEGTLAPFQQPASPYAYDFRMQAFFKGLCATGISKNPPKILGTEPATWRTKLANTRHQMTRLLLTHLPAPQGSLAAALITGDKASVPTPVFQAFSDSGVAHLLAISGLHLSIVAGLFYLLIYVTLGLVPAIALRLPLHKIAACCSLVGTGIYLILSGASYPAQRSFLMTAMVMVAIMLDRPALSMRLVTLAATAVLLGSPQALFSPSFQLSFAAVISLIASYEILGHKLHEWRQQEWSFLHKCLFYVAGCCISTLAADLATMPYTITTFHRFTLQGIVTNFLCIPLTTFALMPLAVATCFLTLFQPVPWTLPWLGSALSLLMEITQTIATWPGAVVRVPLIPASATALLTFGGLWLCFWQTRLRWLGLIGIGLAGIVLYRFTLPVLWVNATSNLMAFWDGQTQTLFLSRIPERSFVLNQWKEELGGNIPNIRPFPKDSNATFRYTAGTQSWHILLARKAPTDLECGNQDIVISLGSLDHRPPQSTLVLDRKDLIKGGTHLVWLTPQGIRVRYNQSVNSNRPWD